jgi:hypothetical protein
LWESCAKWRQVLDFAGLRLHCPIWEQAREIMKIKYLARIQVFAAGPGKLAAPQHSFWG